MKKSSKLSGDQSRAALKRKLRTGVEEELGFFLGGQNAIEGLTPRRAPRGTDEYQAMAVHQIAKRIMDDVEELLARAFAPAFPQSPIAYERRLRAVIHETVAESLCPGLMGRIRSPNEMERKAAVTEYNGYLDKLLLEEPKDAANSVAFITKSAALSLENLSLKRPELMREVAATFDLWPVNLGLKRQRRKDGSRKETFTREQFARRYLAELGLNRDTKLPTGRSGGAQQTSPITLAAESLYEQLLLLKGTNPGVFVEKTQWARRLRALPVPMTQTTKTRWWNVAKEFLYERWEKARHEFAPLEKHLRLGQLDGTKYPYESRIKSRVIDDALKKSFLALAETDL